MLALVLYALLFATANALSIALTGDRKLLSGDLTTTSGALALLLHWRFILAMALALTARVLFVAINSTALSIPSLSQSATTVAALVTSVSYPVIIGVNAWMLHERLSVRQYTGAALIIAGVLLAFSRSSTS
jgi:drug/metabolite transporter (DMT)-like permease